jgi:DNA-binding Xre family transcriptional regulator
MSRRKHAPLDTSFHEKRLDARLKDATLKTEFDRVSEQIAQVDAVLQDLENLREEAGVSKAELVRQIGKDPASVRRLFTAQVRNPELKTVAAIAAALDAEIQVVPRRHPRQRATAG